MLKRLRSHPKRLHSWRIIRVREKPLGGIKTQGIEAGIGRDGISCVSLHLTCGVAKKLTQALKLPRSAT